MEFTFQDIMKCVLISRLLKIGFVWYIGFHCVQYTNAASQQDLALDLPSEKYNPALSDSSSDIYMSNESEYTEDVNVATVNQDGSGIMYSSDASQLDTSTLLRLGQIMATLIESNERHVRGQDEGAPSKIKITDALEKYESFLSQIERHSKKPDAEDRTPGLSWGAAFILTIPPSILAILLAHYLAGNNMNGIVSQIQRRQEQRLKARWRHVDDTFDDPYEMDEEDEDMEERYRSYDDSNDYYVPWTYSRRRPKYSRSRYGRYRAHSRYRDNYAEDDDDYAERSNSRFYQRSSRESSLRSYG